LLLEDMSNSNQLAGRRALIVGIGGLGAPAAAALATAGVGTLGLIDPDKVDISNLHRQPLYVTTDVGRAKVDVAATHLAALAPAGRVVTWRRRFGAGDVGLLRSFDVVLDGTDSIAAKFMLNDAAVAARVPLVHAGVTRFAAQLMTVLPGATACYRCIFEEAPPQDEVPSCEEAGVVGPLPALTGALQAAEAVRILTGGRAAFANHLLTFDARVGKSRLVPLSANPRCPVCAAGHGAHAIGRSEAS
jgi:molybdopterin-synthase adenylyltransferase